MKVRIHMEQFFQGINNIFNFVIPVSDFFWEFPTNFSWYSNIPILGNFSLAIIILVGAGIYCTFSFRFIQITHFKKVIKLLSKKNSDKIGYSYLSDFF